MNSKKILCALFLFSAYVLPAQVSISVDAFLREKVNRLQIDQSILYTNTSEDTLFFLFLNDWGNSFSSKNTPLAKRFAENYQQNFHYAQKEERGWTHIDFIASAKSKMQWVRPKNHPDLIKIELKQPLHPGEKIKIHLKYTLKIPSSAFTRYGYDDGNFKLHYWYITPSVYKNGWQVYSNKNLGDYSIPKSDLNITVDIPGNYLVFSSLQTISENYYAKRKKVSLQGKNRTDTRLYLLLRNEPPFEKIKTGKVHVLTNVKDGKISKTRHFLVNRIMAFLEERLGTYPFQKIWVTQEDYLNDPVYGLNQLPNFIRPYPEGFHYDIKQLKAITGRYLKNSLLLNPRKDKWVIDALQISLMMDYVARYYPKMKLIGTLSDFIGIRWSHLADLEFNKRYALLYMNIARFNLSQSLDTAQDSLITYNQNIANAFKAGIGLKYLEDYLGKETLEKAISKFYRSYKLQPVESSDFKRIINEISHKNTSWFFQDYVQTNKGIDFTIKDVEKVGDSLRVTIKNKTGTAVPISLYGLHNKKIISKTWVNGVQKVKTVSIASDSIEKVALNYEQNIPEINQRDNFHRVTTLFNRPFQVRLFTDVQDPRYNQVFAMPQFTYNLYDGLILGVELRNKTLLAKNFNYVVSPRLGLKSHSLLGYFGFSNIDRFRNQKLHAISYGFSGSRSSYAKGLFYYRFAPFLSIHFRDTYLRDNESQSLSLRSVNVIRDEGEQKLETNPDYTVFNIRYNYSNQNMVDYFTATMDYQIAKQFSKLALTLNYRKLFRNNWKINLRLYAGTFLFNESAETDFFSFALDRPSDYLFDYNYYGRSESSGLFSQQYIRAEGGFKSKLQPAYANQWITTLNMSTTLWKWIYAYGDIGWVKNKGISPQFVYDSGVRISMVDDYFELFFPVYSNLGWEVSAPHYNRKIRFIVTLDFQTLIGLFTRKWY